MAGEVQEPYAAVTVNGLTRKAKSVHITRELGTDLPTAVVGGGDMVAATGTIEWDDDTNGIVDVRVAYPQKLDKVVVTAGMNGATGALAQRFTGMIDTTSGTALDGGVTSTIVDRSRALARPVSMPVHLAKEVSGVGTITETGLTSLWMVHDVARQAGWPAYHYTSDTVIWAALAGSILPHTGDVPGYLDAVGWAPVSTPTGVGIAIDPGRSVEYGYDPIGTGGDKSVEFCLWVDPAADGAYWILNSYNETTGRIHGWYIYMRDGAITVQIYNNAMGAVIVSTTGESGWQPITVHVTWGSTGWTLSVRTSLGITTAFEADTTANTRATDEKWQTTIRQSSTRATAAIVAGFVFDRFPGTTARWAEYNYAPRFKTLGNPADFQTWAASRLITRVDALDVLRDIAKAECAALWVDEGGVLTWMSRQYMRSRPFTKTITSTVNLIDYQWADSLDSLRSSVTVKHLLPAYTVRTTNNLTVWNAITDQKYEWHDSNEIFVEPDTLADWWQPDLTIAWGSVDVKPTRASWWGGKIRASSNDAIVRTATVWDAVVKAEPLGYQTVKLTFTCDDVGAGNYFDTMGTPVVRARGKVAWTEQQYTSTTVGPADASAYEHDAGWYVQTTGARTALANWLATVTNGDKPSIDGIQILPDETVVLGELVTVIDTHQRGWAFNGVVFRVDEHWEDGSATMSLGVRVTSFTPGFAATLAEFDARWAGATLATLDTAHTGDTLSDLDADPLA